MIVILMNNGARVELADHFTIGGYSSLVISDDRPIKKRVKKMIGPFWKRRVVEKVVEEENHFNMFEAPWTNVCYVRREPDSEQT